MKNIEKALAYIKETNGKTLMQRWESKVNKYGPIPEHQKQLGKCWEWTGARTIQMGVEAYGYLAMGPRCGWRIVFFAHRLSWFLNRVDFDDALWVCHRCDNRQCVNPSHLFLGTRQDNVNDMMKKGRLYTPRGIKATNSKLTNDAVLYIRGFGTVNVPISKLAKELGVSRWCVDNVARFRTWKHVH